MTFSYIYGNFEVMRLAYSSQPEKYALSVTSKAIIVGWHVSLSGSFYILPSAQIVIRFRNTSIAFLYETVSSLIDFRGTIDRPISRRGFKIEVDPRYTPLTYMHA